MATAKADNVDNWLDGFVDDVLIPATIAAAADFAKQVETNLQRHRGDRTGTSDQKSDDQRSDETRTPLADSVVVGVDVDGDTVTAVVTVQAENKAKAYWLEYGHPQSFWGKDSGGMQQPRPVFRQAFDGRQNQAFNAFAETLTKELVNYAS